MILSMSISNLLSRSFTLQFASLQAAWMQVTPERGVLMPQESIKLDIIVHIGDRVAGLSPAMFQAT